MEIVDNLFMVFLLMLLVGIVSGSIAKAIRVPDIILYLLCGILLINSISTYHHLRNGIYPVLWRPFPRLETA
jgi:Kef-type K+ transport system membrane component KefB